MATAFEGDRSAAALSPPTPQSSPYPLSCPSLPGLHNLVDNTSMLALPCACWSIAHYGIRNIYCTVYFTNIYTACILYCTCRCAETPQCECWWQSHSLNSMHVVYRATATDISAQQYFPVQVVGHVLGFRQESTGAIVHSIQTATSNILLV